MFGALAGAATFNVEGPRVRKSSPKFPGAFLEDVVLSTLKGRERAITHAVGIYICLNNLDRGGSLNQTLYRIRMKSSGDIA